MMDSIFFAKEGEKGITVTNAANMIARASDLATEAKYYLDNLDFCTEKAGLLSSEVTRVTHVGIDNLDDLIANVDRLGELNGFIAFYREATKAYQEEFEKVENYALEDYLKEYNITWPKYENTITKETAKVELNVEEKRSYLELEARAAVYKLIHPQGSFRKAREDAYEISRNPIEVTGEGSDSVVYTKELSIPLSVIDSNYTNLQIKYREVEAELNRRKSNIKQRLSDKEREINQEYQRQLDEINAKNQLVINECNRIRSMYNQVHQDKINAAKKVKLVIPKKYEGWIAEFSKKG